MQTDYDDYDDYDGPGLRWMSVVILLLAIAGFFSLAWYAYYTGTKSVGDEDDVIIIEADTTPIKEQPENSGGMEFPHQDKTIYDAVEGSARDVTPKPIAEAEKPVIPEDMPSKTIAPKKRVSADDEIAKIIEEATRDSKPTATIDRKINKPIRKPEPKSKLVVAKPKPVATIAPKPLVVAKKVAPSAAGIQLQLGAFRSSAEAEATWNKIRRSHLDILDNASHRIVRADLGAKGIYYRLRVTGLGANAGQACATLKARNQACFIVK